MRLPATDPDVTILASRFCLLGFEKSRHHLHKLAGALLYITASLVGKTLTAGAWKQWRMRDALIDSYFRRLLFLRRLSCADV